MAAQGLAHPLLLSSVMNMDTMNIGGTEVQTTYVFFTWCGMIFLLLLGLFVKSRISLIPERPNRFLKPSSEDWKTSSWTPLAKKAVVMFLF